MADKDEVKIEQDKIDALISDDNDYLNKHAYADALGSLTEEQKKKFLD